MTARVDHDAVAFRGHLVTVTTAAGRRYRRFYFRAERAISYARGAQARGATTRIEAVTVTRTREAG